MIETKPASRLTQLAVKGAVDAFNAHIAEIVQSAMDIEGVKADEGWRFDANVMAYTRNAPEPPKDPA